MNKEQIELLAKAYLGKVCTILTNSTSIPVNGVQHSQYFSGEVARIDPYSIWVKHLLSGKMSVFFFPVIGIVEEDAVMPEDPRYEKIKEEIEKQKPKKSTPQGNYISVEELTSSLDRLRKKA